MTINNLPDFLIIPRIILVDKDLQPLDGCVYGVVYWYTQLKLERCIASSETIATVLNSTVGGVQNAINRLVKTGCLQSIYDRKSHIRELIPMISFDKQKISTTSNNVVAPHQMMTGTTSNDVSTQVHLGSPNKKNEEEKLKNIPPSPQGGEDWSLSNALNVAQETSSADGVPANRLAVQEIFDHYMQVSGANNNTKLFVDRQNKIKKRLESFTPEQIKIAITNCYKDSFYSGHNDKSWKADIDYIMRNDRNVEKLLYLKPREEESRVYHEQ